MGDGCEDLEYLSSVSLLRQCVTTSFRLVAFVPVAWKPCNARELARLHRVNSLTAHVGKLVGEYAAGND